MILVALFVIGVCSQELSPELSIRRAEVGALSEIPYASLNRWWKGSPRERAQRAIAQQVRLGDKGAIDPQLSPVSRLASRHVADMNRGLEVLDANRDAVALRDKRTGRVTFSFRGTMAADDLWQDVLVATNSKNIQRLNEARQFVEKVRRQHPLKASEMQFTGHSLGGFIATALARENVGSRSGTIAAPGPLIGNSPRAFKQGRGGHHIPTQTFTRQGDLVSARVQALGSAQVIVQDKAFSRNPLANHLPDAYLPWNQKNLPVERKASAPGVFGGAQQAYSSVRSWMGSIGKPGVFGDARQAYSSVRSWMGSIGKPRSPGGVGIAAARKQPQSRPTLNPAPPRKQPQSRPAPPRKQPQSRPTLNPAPPNPWQRFHLWR
jgi:hypothetical protein